jgi:hypothetical protein
MKTNTLSLCFAAALVFAAGCAGSHKKSNDERANVAEFEVKVLDAGAEPRKPLRYQRVAGRSERLIIQLGLARFLETTQGADLSAAAVKVGLNVGAISPVEKDVWAYPITLELVGVETPASWTEDERAFVEKQLEPLSQVTGTFQVDTRGVTRRADLNVPSGLSPRLLALLGNVRTLLVSAPFPVDAVGVGARWQVERPVQVGPIKATQTTTYTLLERQESVLRIGVTIQQSATPQDVMLSKDGADKLSLEAYQVSSVGSSVVNLEDITPHSELRGNSEMRAVLHRGGQAPVAVAVGGELLVNVEPVSQTP